MLFKHVMLRKSLRMRRSFVNLSPTTTRTQWDAHPLPPKINVLLFSFSTVFINFCYIFSDLTSNFPLDYYFTSPFSFWIFFILSSVLSFPPHSLSSCSLLLWSLTFILLYHFSSPHLFSSRLIFLCFLSSLFSPSTFLSLFIFSSPLNSPYPSLFLTLYFSLLSPFFSSLLCSISYILPRLFFHFLLFFKKCPVCFSFLPQLLYFTLSLYFLPSLFSLPYCIPSSCSLSS